MCANQLRTRILISHHEGSAFSRRIDQYSSFVWIDYHMQNPKVRHIIQLVGNRFLP